MVSSKMCRNFIISLRTRFTECFNVRDVIKVPPITILRKQEGAESRNVQLEFVIPCPVSEGKSYISVAECLKNYFDPEENVMKQVQTSSSYESANGRLPEYSVSELNGGGLL